MGAYITAKCRCRGCKQWSADYARDRKRARTGRVEREWSPRWRRDPTEYLGADLWRRIWSAAVDDARLPFAYTPYQAQRVVSFLRGSVGRLDGLRDGQPKLFQQIDCLATWPARTRPGQRSLATGRCGRGAGCRNLAPMQPQPVGAVWRGA